ncbi:MAG: indole-3-glycerol phosphate synthase TrpC [Kurthia sp.]|nr:indole-3-glycerol phosphate synthase TrpC [Candidatus Kurthia equi]
MTILEKILKEKENEVAYLMEKKPPKDLQLPIHSLYERLLHQQSLQVIAEIKRASPSKGEINGAVNPVEQAKQYEAAGAACISVLTDTPFFKGTFDDLRQVAAAVNIPVLCKDFIIHSIQIDYARAAGASVILLIVAALEKEKLHELYAYAKALKLDVLVEVHNQAEYKIAEALGAKIIGVNNRNLKTFEVDLQHTESIASQFSRTEGRVLISESGIKTVEDAQIVSSYGANAILVGETLMRATNVMETLPQLKVQKVGVL